MHTSQLYMLADGQCIYYGNIPGLVPFLSYQGLKCPSYHNPADYGKVWAEVNGYECDRGIRVWWVEV